MSCRAAMRWVAGLAVVAFVLIAAGSLFVPHDNPPVTQTIAWDSALTEQLARDACFDCHSNETKWPWYAHVAPIAFLIVNHVNEGREEMNLSTGHDVEADEMVKPIRGGEMPLPVYLPLHPEANLTQEQEDALIAGILATFGEGSDS